MKEIVAELPCGAEVSIRESSVDSNYLQVMVVDTRGRWFIWAGDPGEVRESWREEGAEVASYDKAAVRLCVSKKALPMLGRLIQRAIKGEGE